MAMEVMKGKGGVWGEELVAGEDVSEVRDGDVDSSSGAVASSRG